jgi:probable phosphoglycerate mutase
MLYIMRHGKTDWNAAHKLQGRTDIPLNDEGRRMAAEAARTYAAIPLDLCYCSPLSRAKETAEIFLRGRDIPIVPDERLCEMSFGIYEGTEHASHLPDSPIAPLFNEPQNYLVPVEGGESFEALFARTGQFLCEVVEPQLRQGKNILIIGHGAMNASIIGRIRNIPLERFWSAGLDQCQMVRLR